MRKFVICIISLLTVLAALAILVVSRRKIPGRKGCKDDTTTIGMRDIENPFETVEAQPEEEPADVVVALKDYSWWRVYKNDILAIIGVLVVISLIVVVSIFANMSRIKLDDDERAKKEKQETSVIQALGDIEQTTVELSGKVDSLDAHFKEETTKLRNVQPVH